MIAVAAEVKLPTETMIKQVFGFYADAGAFFADGDGASE